MVDEVRKFRAACGQEFDTPEEAHRHEKQDSVANALADRLRDRGGLPDILARVLAIAVVLDAAWVRECLDLLPKVN